MRIDKVIKLGGSLLAHPRHWRATLDAIERGAAGDHSVVVPGGGPFADAVRIADARLDFGDDAAHWMAIMAMDQHAHAITAALARAALVEELAGIVAASEGGRIPVLAPYRWLRAVDPLPHSWDVTSDSLAAWIAGQLGASELVLIKPPGSTGERVDAYFAGALPAGVMARAVAADEFHQVPHLR